MLKLFEGDFSTDARWKMLKELKSAVIGGERCYLFVPEQQTLLTESEMCAYLPPSAPLCFEVTNFTRFINTAQRALGGIGKGYCKGAESALIMWRALTELSPFLTVTGGGSRVSFGTVNRALSAVRDLESRGVTPELLSEAERQEGIDQRLRDKLADIGKIYALYKRMLNESYSDVNADMLFLADTLAEKPEFISGAKIFVDGFTSFTEPQYRLLGVLMRLCDVSVHLTLPREESSLFEYSEVKKAHGRLIALADRAGCKKASYRSAEDITDAAPSISAVCSLLWRRDGKLDNNYLHNLSELGGRVRIFEADTPFDECDFLASDIKRRIMEGARYSDFAVIAGNTDNYVGILDTALSRANIPCFLSKRQGIMGMEAIKLINTAYSTVLCGFAREDVITYTKCGLCEASREERDEFELYCETWQIEGKRFTDEEEWNMNPEGYSARSEKSAEKLARINATRDKIIPPLVSFREDVRHAKCVREHADALFRFLTDIKLEEALCERAKNLYESGEYQAAEENARLWEIICSSLDTVVDLLGAAEADAESFTGQLNVVFEETSIGHIPAFCDAVTVGSADMLRTGRKRHVYMIGVNAGEFPASVTDSSYFSEREKSKLSDMGLPLEPDLEIKTARARYCFSRAFMTASDTVTLMYTSKSASGGAVLPDSVIDRISEITDKRIIPVNVGEIPTLDRIFSPSDAILLRAEAAEEDEKIIRSALLGTEYGGIIRVSEGEISNTGQVLGKDAIGILYKNELYLSQTKLDKFLSCPFSYFCKYGIRPSDTERAEFNSRIIGSFIHSILENFFETIKQRSLSVQSLSDSERRDLAMSAAESYITATLGDRRSAKTDMAINRLCRASMPVVDALCDEFANCKFTPTFFELPIGGRDKGTPNSIVYSTRDGGKAIINGIVDRVDSFRHGEDVYVRVLDYKTGSKVFSPTDLKEGENLQMFLYMKAIADTKNPEFLEKVGVGKGGRIIPAGVLYVTTSVKDARVTSASDESASEAVKELYKRQGMILDDPINLEASNPDYMPENRAKSDEVTYTEEEWKEITDGIEEVVLDIVDNMKSGDISASPNKSRSRIGSPCDFCDYKPVCRASKESSWRP